MFGARAVVLMDIRAHAPVGMSEQRKGLIDSFKGRMEIVRRTDEEDGAGHEWPINAGINRTLIEFQIDRVHG